MPPPSIIHDLVQRFDDNRLSYRSGGYNETQLRREFLDPFFEALGWDVFNKQGFAEAYKDVIHEDAIKVGSGTRAPDYAFCIGGTRKFFVEAKKPSVNIKEDVSPAFQLRRYAWSAKLPLSILTDFEEFAVYECRSRPDRSDKVSTGRLMLLNYPDYLPRWDEIAAIFSRSAVLKGSFDRYAEATAGKHGTAEVDDAFLAEIERWRDLLARNIALRNPQLSQRELNFAVQMTIDRIIFLRIAEDRGIEPYGALLGLLNGSEIYARLGQLFRKADERYNSGLFHFRPEKSQDDAPDCLTLSLSIDDRSLKDLLSNLYYPDSPYEFSVLPLDILGQVYEQFLGKVIRLTAGHHAVVEDKPEVKKAGGVFYTPTYIVEYIVNHTLGTLLQGKKPSDYLPRPSPKAGRGVGGEGLRILDPACGSGSFLLGAYQYLLDWYRDGYIADDPEKWARGPHPRLTQTPSHAGELPAGEGRGGGQPAGELPAGEGRGGGWKLTTAERKRILLDHIYGVDIDPQAVEVTKLSLLLKVLEGESEGSLARQLSFWQQRALPDLGQNIQCGNSLIGPDFYQGKQVSFLDPEEQYRINAFDWQASFPQVFKDGGFDVVIGNPPYIRIQALKEWAPKEVEFYKQRYVAASKGNYDIYVVFVEKGLSLLNQQGRLGFILPSKFFATDYGDYLRKLIVEKQALSQIVDFGHTQVFERATTYTCLLFLSNLRNPYIEYAKVANVKELLDTVSFSRHEHFSTSKPWIFADYPSSNLAQKIEACSKPLGELPARIGRGSSSGADQIFVISREVSHFKTYQGDDIDIEREILRSPIHATDFGRYRFQPTSNQAIIFPYKVEKHTYRLIAEDEFKQKYPKAYKYLLSKKRELNERKQYNAWYSFSAPRNLDVHETAQLLVPLLANRGLFCRLLDNSSDYCLMASGGFSITISLESGLSPNYVLGLLNSSLLFWRLRSISNIFRGGWITCTKQYVETLPIHLIDFSNPSDVQRHDSMITLVDRMLSLHQQLAAANTPTEKNMLQRQIDFTDHEIDRLVYDLYSLTEEEIKIVEGEQSFRDSIYRQ
jgi:hypothetical protein